MNKEEKKEIRNRVDEILDESEMIVLLDDEDALDVVVRDTKRKVTQFVLCHALFQACEEDINEFKATAETYALMMKLDDKKDLENDMESLLDALKEMNAKSEKLKG